MMEPSHIMSLETHSILHDVVGGTVHTRRPQTMLHWITNNTTTCEQEGPNMKTQHDVSSNTSDSRGFIMVSAENTICGHLLKDNEGRSPSSLEENCLASNKSQIGVSPHTRLPQKCNVHKCPPEHSKERNLEQL